MQINNRVLRFGESMEEKEKKNVPPVNGGGNHQNNQGNPNAQNGNGGRKRRRKKHNRGGGNHQNGQNAQNNQTAQNQTADKAQRSQNQNQQQHQNQNQNKNQNGGNGGNAGNSGNGKQTAKQQSQPQNSNHKQNQKNNADKAQNSVSAKQNQDENRKDTYAYVLDGNLYINLTNKCSNGCDFCVRNERASYYGHYLWLRHGEPTVEKVIAQINGLGDLKRFKEAVFCGFGEPTYKVAEMLALCDYFHEKGLSTRLNTNGQGNLINKRDIVPDLKGKIDLVNVSLNASASDKYQKSAVRSTV